MATVDRPHRDKGGNVISYRIRVSQGFDYNGKRITPITTTFNVPAGLTEKQALKEARRYALAVHRSPLSDGFAVDIQASCQARAHPRKPCKNGTSDAS